jgi:hypothetical protein
MPPERTRSYERTRSTSLASTTTTPSKKVGLCSTAHSGALLTDSLLSAEEVPEVDGIEDLRTRFVGDIKVTEVILVLFIVLNVSPDRNLKTKSHCLSNQSDHLTCSLFNTPRHVPTHLLSRLI